VTNAPRISIAIAVCNEESVLPDLLVRLGAVLDNLPGGPHEVVFVDDGSRDRSVEILQQADLRHQVTVVCLSRNFGHQAAISAALDHVTGDAIVVMDGDLQDTPETIPRFLEEFAQGYDVVYAIRTQRKEGVLLRFCYAAFYRVISALADIHLPVGAGDFALMSRRVVDELRATPERNRYLRGLRTWVGFRQTGIPVERAERHSGKSKYNVRRLFRLAFDGIFGFSVIPLRVSTMLGVFTIGGSMLFSLYALYAKFFLDVPIGFTALILAVMFLSGVQLLSLGIIGEYLGRVYEEVKQRPRYVVGSVIHVSTKQSQTAP
jgi:glycosyltransferase involved in cell wall biosynthesis